MSTMPEDPFLNESREWQRDRLTALLFELYDDIDRSRERRSWPDEIKQARKDAHS